MARPKSQFTTLQDVADHHKCSLKTVKRYKAEGVDVFDDEQFIIMKSACEATGYHSEKLTSDDAIDLKIKKLAAETKRMTALASIEELKLKRLKNSLVSLSEVESTMLTISTKIKNQLKKMIVELPPKLAGLEPDTMIEIIRTHTEEILTSLYNDFNNAKN